ncbi:non-specific lipid transfer protein GPI-anchored 20-like, partial [Phragmites australis]|uniref:non-specific lipid transfer protein GPI-anchored 20-like n=1 Tax=Phragmites australis TaxID=29695 RepID=UPI002D76743B
RRPGRASLVTSFTPCLDFITNGTASLTADCCRSLGALVKASTGCACLILTGNVPLGVPINRTLAVTLPKACNSMSVPLQCRAPATPGPEAPAPPAEPTATPPVSQGQTRPMVVPSSARTASSHVPATAAFLLLLLAAGAAVV